MNLAKAFTRLADGVEAGDGFFPARVIIITEGLEKAGWAVSGEPCINCGSGPGRCAQGAGGTCCRECSHGSVKR